MNFIAVHKSASSGGDVFYLNPQHVTMIEHAADKNGSRILLANGTSVDVIEKGDDLILKIRGFTKPLAAPDLAHHDRFADSESVGGLSR